MWRNGISYHEMDELDLTNSYIPSKSTFPCFFYDISDVKRSHRLNGSSLVYLWSRALQIYSSSCLTDYLSDYVHALQLMTDLYLAFKHVMCTKTHTRTHTMNLNAPFSLKQKVPLSSTWWSYQEGWENYSATHSRATNQIALYCCVKAKQTSKGVFFICCWPRKRLHGATVTTFTRLMIRSIWVMHGANEISLFLRLVWFSFRVHKFHIYPFISFLSHTHWRTLK